MRRRSSAERVEHRIRLAAGMDRHTLEALWLELQRLGRRHRLEIEIRVERTAMRRSA
jgi:hypothetical protein